jgi:hypothetical protein
MQDMTRECAREAAMDGQTGEPYGSLFDYDKGMPDMPVKLNKLALL